MPQRTPPKQLFFLLIAACLVLSVSLLLGSITLVLVSRTYVRQLLVVTSAVAGAWAIGLALLGRYMMISGDMPPVEWPERLRKPRFLKPVASDSMGSGILPHLVGAGGLLWGFGTLLYLARLSGETDFFYVLGAWLGICGALGVLLAIVVSRVRV
jgi:hypothetical protein